MNQPFHRIENNRQLFFGWRPPAMRSGMASLKHGFQYVAFMLGDFAFVAKGGQPFSKVPLVSDRKHYQTVDQRPRTECGKVVRARLKRLINFVRNLSKG